MIDPEVLNNADDKTKFMVEMFPTEIAQFLIPAHIYESKRASFESLQNLNKIVGQRFKTHRGN